jgi:DNA-binding NtrC family response regulator
MTKKIIFIDDDPLILKSWEMSAQAKNITIHTFQSIDEFLKNNFSKDIPIYIDSNLSDNLKGEQESQKLFELGYTELFLATAHDPETIEKPQWIKEVIGKRFPL